MPLLQEGLRSICDCSKQWMFWTSLILRILPGILSTKYLSMALMDDADSDVIEYAIRMYVLIEVSSQLLDYIANRLSEFVTSQIYDKMMENAYTKYSQMDHNSKQLEPIDDFRKKLLDAASALTLLIDWGMPTSVHLTLAIINAIWIFYTKSLISIFWWFIIINLLVYLIITRYLQMDYANSRESTSTLRDELQSHLRLRIGTLEINNDYLPNIINLDNNINATFKTTRQKWDLINFVTSQSNQIPYVLFLFTGHDDITYFLLMVSTFHKFTSALHSCINFMNQYTLYSMHFTTYEKIWINKTFNEPVMRMDLPNKWHITNINICPTSSYNISGNPLIIEKGDQILVYGKSGAGKSTFFNALFGKIDGIDLSHGRPENFYHCVVEFYQNIKEKMPTKTITIRNLFDDELDNDIINRCLQIACVDNWANKLVSHSSDTTGTKISSKASLTKLFPNILKRRNILPLSKDDDDYESNNYSFHPYDIKIYDRISGGEKTRLALATRIYYLLKHRETTKILLLDEPEQGSDPQDAYKIIDNVRELCETYGITFIIISHLERIHEYTWTKKLHVIKSDDGSCSYIQQMNAN